MKKAQWKQQSNCQDNTTIYFGPDSYSPSSLTFQRAGDQPCSGRSLDLDFIALLPPFNALSLLVTSQTAAADNITPQSLLSPSHTVLSSNLQYNDSQSASPGTTRLTGFNSHGPALSSCQHWHPAALQHLSQETKL
jgi:hypothetical protein